MIWGASIESSLAQTLVAARTLSTPRSSATGRARSAMRAPTASRQTGGGMGDDVRAKRDSPARSMTSESVSGSAREGRRRRRRMGLSL